MLIVIDGTAGAGKSSTARQVAEATGFVLMDSGLMYRGVAWACLEHGTRIEETELTRLLESLDFEVKHDGLDMRVLINGLDVTDRLRDYTVSAMASRVAKTAAVRSFLLKLQHDLGHRYRQAPGLVAEGRDMGTVVFPDADLKFYFTASVEVRARRRRQQFKEQGVQTSLRGLQKSMAQRDRADSERDLAPLKKDPGAITVNTDHITLDHQVALVLKRVREQASKSTH